MLVVSRKKHEQIIIGGEIEITIVEIRGDHVRLGFNAPEHIPIYREEIQQRIDKEKAEQADKQRCDESPLGP